jgi:hypothetical protein
MLTLQEQSIIAPPCSNLCNFVMCVGGSFFSLRHKDHHWLSITSQKETFLLFKEIMCAAGLQAACLAHPANLKS